MKLLFVVSGYCREQLNLQPWLTIHRVGCCLSGKGHKLHIVTDGCTDGNEEGIAIHGLTSLRGSNSLQIKTLLEKINPDKIIVCISQLSLVTADWYEIFTRYDAYAFMSNAFYRKTEFIKAIPYLSLRDIIRFGSQVAVPDSLWSRKLNQLFKGVICQSVTTTERLKKTLKSSLPLYWIPPGIDLELWPLVKNKSWKSSQSIFLYAGSPKKIRGFDVILKAFSKIDSSDICLKILARGAGSQETARIEKQVKSYGIRCTVDVIGGWLSQKSFRKHIYNARAVLLPFVLVPSELPVTVMESIACGTPVIVTKIDGLPDAAGRAGITIPHADCISLVKALYLIHSDTGVRESMNNACCSVRGEMQSWPLVADKWVQALTR